MKPLRAVVELPCRVPAVPHARAVARGAVAAWGRAHLADDVALVVSELVTNAVVHAPDSEVLTLEVLNRTDGVRIVLADGSSIAPVVRDLSGPLGSVDGRQDATSGRGMAIVHALASGWGVDAHGDGKRVWVEIADAASPLGSSSALRRSSTDERVG